MAADVAKPATLNGTHVLSTVIIDDSTEADDFGLRKAKMPTTQEDKETVGNAPNLPTGPRSPGPEASPSTTKLKINGNQVGPHEDRDGESDSENDEFRDAKTTPRQPTADPRVLDSNQPTPDISRATEMDDIPLDEPTNKVGTLLAVKAVPSNSEAVKKDDGPKDPEAPPTKKGHSRGHSSQGQISEWSHQRIMAPEEEADKVGLDDEDEWQAMPAFAPYDIYDDNNKLIAREAEASDEEGDAYAGLGGAGKGYTRLQIDEDAQSATSLDENTQYLFKDINGGTGTGEMEDEEQRDAVSQMQATKDLLTEGQRIAYVGMTRLITSKMIMEAETVETTKGSKKELVAAAQSLQLWSQKMMVRLYAHMEISTEEQLMIEQLADHGVIPADLTSTLMQNARVKNPMAEQAASTTSLSSPRDIMSPPNPRSSYNSSRTPPHSTPDEEDEEPAAPPPPYEKHNDEELPEVRTPSQLPTSEKLDIDLRWTVLCDLFLTLIADSVYDARSRVLLENLGKNMEISWLEICRFEKRVTDALEMQQEAEKENWNEDEHKETRRKLALKKRYIMMGLATVGGGLVIGLSAGLLAPMIGAGLAAGFSTVGIAGTSGFLAGAGGAAVITTGATSVGGVIGVRAANRRTGAVKTFEYRPLHNNKRVNLIVTVSGWMTGKVDDVRLPFSTIDPIMGDIYSILWEPEMLRSTGATINILATEALTQGLQQVLGSTVLIGLMAALQLPIVLTKLSYLIDNPWTVSLDRANSAGLILADSLIDRNLGTRPITFVGYSLGCRMIFSCLQELAKKGACGLVQNVYLFGSPIVAKRDEYLKVRSVVAGRFVNGYARNDWILGYLFRMTSGGISRVAGLAPVEGIPGLENVDVTAIVPGHMSYRQKMPRLLREVGWMVESDEFTEIEDPDPDDHSKRHRELINEIEEARKEFEKKEKEKESKGKFGFFSRKKHAAVEKQEWETYQEGKDDSSSTRTGDAPETNKGVLFDVDAIRAELASQQMEVRELKSTLPPMKLVIDSNPMAVNPRSPHSSLRETQSCAAPSSTTPPAGSRSISASPHAANGAVASPMDEPYSNPPEDEPQMTFDNSYHSPPRSMTSSTNHLPIHTPTPPLDEPQAQGVGLQRPDLKSSNTLPSTLAMPDMNLDHNAWADEEEEFGGEKEIEMTFA